MRCVIQRVKEASVSIAGTQHACISYGYLILCAFTPTDTLETLEWMTRKILALRLMNDEQGVMNKSIQETAGHILVVSQFTLYGNAQKGNRPSYIQSANREIAEPLYASFVRMLTQQHAQPVVQGVFGADMQVALVNDGPVTLIIDAPQK